MKLSVQTALDLRNLLPALDGCERVVGERVVREPYRYADGKTYLTIAILKNRLDTFADTIETQRKALIRAHAPEETPNTIDGTKHPERWSAFTEAWGKLLAAEQEIDLPTIRFAEFGGASIPAATVIAPLMLAGVVTSE